MKRHLGLASGLVLLMACQPAPLAPVHAARQVLSVAEAAVPDSSPITTHAADRRDLTLTIYNGNMALVQDDRQATLPTGQVRLRFEDVPAGLDPGTLSLFAPSETGAFSVLEQTTDQDTISLQKLLDAYVGKQVQIRMPAEGDRPAQTLDATLVSTQGGNVFEIGGKIYLQPPGTVILPSLPEGMSAVPSVNWLLNVERPGSRVLEARYVISGISWQADYTLTLGAGGAATLSGLATIQNQTGQRWPDARVGLVAGNLNRAAPMPIPSAAPVAYAAAAPRFSEEPVGDYHAYALNRRATLEDKQTTQLPLFDQKTIQVTRRYVFDSRFWGSDKPSEVAIEVSFANSAAAGLGLPLPAGRIHAYGPQGQGSVLLGEAAIDHTAVGETVRATIGKAFDVTGTHAVLNTTRLDDKTHDDAYKVVLSNASANEVTVEVVEHPYGDWQVTTSSVPGKRVSVNELRFSVPVPAGGQATLTYTIRTKEQ
ncbi:MAG TPA: DUF4139 domain-containing protein [Oscillatoriaceae cyanobacterium]